MEALTIDFAPTVFMIDDDPEVLRSLSHMILTRGLPVEAFSSAEEFLDQYDPGSPGCLILDLVMPTMSGWEVQERLASLGSQLPTIILTGKGDVSKCAQAFRAGAFDFLEKPVRSQFLVTCVLEAIEQDARYRRMESSTPVVAARL